MTKNASEKPETKTEEKVQRGPITGMDLVMDVMRKVRAQLERLPSASDAEVVLGFATHSVHKLDYTPAKTKDPRQAELFSEDLPE